MSGSNVRFLDFGFYGVYPQHSNYRAHGFPLRCLQKEGGGRAADFTLESGGLSVRENLLRLACGAVELWGLNDSLSSPPLEPRGLLLSVMRQKVGKERSQGVFAPLANPHRFLACPLRKFDLAPTPLRLCKTPVGVPSGTAEAGDAKHRDQLYKTSPPRNQPQA